MKSRTQLADRPDRTGVPFPFEPARRIAWCSYVDDNYFAGFETLLRSLVLENPGICVDYIVLYDDLSLAQIERCRALYPRIRFVPVDREHYASFAKGNLGNYLVEKAYYILEIFRLRDVDTVITLDTDMVVTGDLGALLDVRDPLAAVPQYFANPTGALMNSGLLVVNRRRLPDDIFERLTEIGRSGSYELDKHDQGILNAEFGGDFRRLDETYNFVKRRVASGLPVPDDVRILHFTGSIKPWRGSEPGYEPAEEVWHRYALGEEDHLRLVLASEGLHPALVAHFGRRYLDEIGFDREVALRTVAAARRVGQRGGIAELLSRDPEPQREDPLRGTLHLQLGVAFRERSEYLRARHHLRVASLDRSTAPQAFESLAEVAWIVGEDDAAREWLASARQQAPLDVRLEAVRDRLRPTPNQPGDGTARVVHVAFHMNGRGNAGDKLLPAAVRGAIDGRGQTTWEAQHVHRLFSETALERANGSNGVVVGGGGLFLPDTSPNGTSGWQWNVPDRALEGLRVPLVLFGVGYNLFPGQEMTNERFLRSLRGVVERAAFVGLRNWGSVERVRDLLPEDLRDRVTYQPCPTTVTRRLGWLSGHETSARSGILLNVAYDRFERRFGHDYGWFLHQMARAIRAMRSFESVAFAAHAVGDERFVDDLRRAHDIELSVVPLHSLPDEEILRTYARSRLVVGMRGHAIMVPFGVGTPTVSLVSHRKLGYFLEDLGRLSWGVSIGAENLAERLTDAVVEQLQDHDGVIAANAAHQDELWSITSSNVGVVRDALGLPPQRSRTAST